MEAAPKIVRENADIIGTGNWRVFDLNLDQVFDAAQEWSLALQDISKPWLCWNVSARWCLVQQRLVQQVGWTPVVGYDPRVGPPPLAPGAVLIDFNRHFQFPVMWLHFPLEFAFRWAPRLAFWHADLLCRISVMQHLAQVFESLKDGELAAAMDRGGRRNIFRPKQQRFWELCGCTTRSASENQFYNGTGWWRCFAFHPKCTLPDERARRKKYSYDSGAGILYWKKNYNGAIRPINISAVKEGHCSEIGKRSYKSLPSHLTAKRDLAGELDLNYSIDEVAARLGIAGLLE
jgi:hypothetical protein